MEARLPAITFSHPHGVRGEKIDAAEKNARHQAPDLHGAGSSAIASNAWAVAAGL